MLLKFYSRVNVREREMMGRVGEISDVCRCLFQFISKLHCLLACSRSYSRYVREILIKFSTKFSLVCVFVCASCEREFFFMLLHAIYFPIALRMTEGMETKKRSLIDDGFIGFPGERCFYIFNHFLHSLGMIDN